MIFILFIVSTTGSLSYCIFQSLPRGKWFIVELQVGSKQACVLIFPGFPQNPLNILVC